MFHILNFEEWPILSKRTYHAGNSILSEQQDDAIRRASFTGMTEEATEYPRRATQVRERVEHLRALYSTKIPVRGAPRWAGNARRCAARLKWWSTQADPDIMGW